MPDDQEVGRLRRGLVQEAKLLAADRNASAWFGTSNALSADGNTAIVGANGDDDQSGTPTVDSGAAYIYVRNGTTWTQEAKLLAADKMNSDRFGTGVAISADGNTVLVGSYGSDDANMSLTDSGAAYVFTRSGTTWTQEAKLQATDRASSDLFGIWVSLSFDGNTALLGAYGKDESVTVTDVGAAYVFTRSAGSWMQEAKLQASDPNAGDLFGSSVTLSGDGNTALIGASGHDEESGVPTTNSGAGYIFVRNGTMWTEQQKILASDRGDNDNFGRNVTLTADGNALVITAQVQDDESTNNFDNGAAYYFTRTSGLWTETQKLVSPDKADNDRFGTGISISADGKTLLVGARFDDDPNGNAATDNGSAYIYKQTANGWLYQGKLVANDRLNDDWGGYHACISADGKTALLGSYGEDDDATGIVDNGAAYIFVLGDALGDACTTDAQCISGHCADGVCCDSACGDSVADDCQACTAAMKQSGKDSGQCGAAKSTIVCRGSAGVCDVADFCDGTSMACPMDAKRQSGFICRSSAGPCDLAETCDGKGDVCPKTDAVKSAGTQCKAPGISQICDPADVCDGRTKLCPLRYGAPGMDCGGGKVCRVNGICG